MIRIRFTIPSIAEELGISSNTIYKAIKEGHVKVPRKNNNAYRIDSESLDAIYSYFNIERVDRIKAEAEHIRNEKAFRYDREADISWRFKRELRNLLQRYDARIFLNEEISLENFSGDLEIAVEFFGVNDPLSLGREYDGM